MLQWYYKLRREKDLIKILPRIVDNNDHLLVASAEWLNWISERKHWNGYKEEAFFQFIDRWDIVHCLDNTILEKVS